MLQSLPFKGLVAAPYTPFHADGSLNLAMIPRLAERLRADGVRGAFVCGTTGEGISMTLDERMAVAKCWVEAAEGLRIFVNVSHSCLADARTLATHAARIGAGAIATLAPNFFKPANVSVMVDYCVALTEAAPDTPFYMYHIPALTGVEMSMSAFMQQAITHIPSFAGLKYTDYDLKEYCQCLALAGERYEVCFGRDEMLLGALATGAQSAVGSTYNFMAAPYLRMIEAFAAGELAEAQAWQVRIADAINVLGACGGLAAGKVMMKLIGLDCGPVRLPLRGLTPEVECTLREQMERLLMLECVK